MENTTSFETQFNNAVLYLKQLKELENMLKLVELQGNVIFGKWSIFTILFNFKRKEIEMTPYQKSMLARFLYDEYGRVCEKLKAIPEDIVNCAKKAK